MMVWLKALNWVDVLIIILVLRGVILGFIHGFSREFAGLFKTIFSLVVAFFTHSFLAKLISSRLNLSFSISNIFSFILIYVLFHFLLNVLMRVRKEQDISFLKRVAGGGVGLVKGVMVAFFILLFLNFLPITTLKKAIEEDSLFTPYFLKVSEKIWDYAEHQIDR